MAALTRFARLLRSGATLVLITCAGLGADPAIGKALSAMPDPELEPLRALVRQPEGRIDFAKAKLTIDRLMDPSLDVRATRRTLDDLAARIRARFPAGAGRRQKLELLLSSVYQAGAWNSGRPFSYDLNDPFGTNLRTKQLSAYLATRKGNCVSMPILFLILGQELGLPVTLATAPQHVMVKYLDEDGQWLNVEATAGGFKYDSSYIRETGITDKAVQNEIYLRPLSQRESVAAMLTTLMEFYGQRGQQERRLAVADMVLHVDPRNVDAMVHKGAGNYLLLRERFVSRYPDPAQIPVPLRPEFHRMSKENLDWYARAEALGWALPSQAQDARYLESIQREKTAQGVRQ